MNRDELKELIKESLLEEGFGTEYPDYLTESLILEGSNEDMKQLMANWKTSNQIHLRKMFKSDVITEEEYEQIHEWIHIMKTTEDYKEYKPIFDKFCKFCHILPTGTIITKFKLTSGKKKDHNTLYVEYFENTRKIKIPEGMKLYHMSKTSGIKALTPKFRLRGKPGSSGYLCDKPRVYFTIRKNMPKFLADYKMHEVMHKYECKANIKEVYVDPLVWAGKLTGALYVESLKEIPVEEMGIPKKN